MLTKIPALVLGLLIGVSIPSVRQRYYLHRAFLAQEALDGDCMGHSECYGMDASYVLSERWKNYRAQAEDMVKLPEVTTIEIQSTADTHTPVVTLCAGTKCNSVWADENGKVRSVTPY